MVRSSGFGSVNYDLKLLSSSLSLWLQYFLTLTLPQPTSRQLILQQARSRALSRSSTACKLTISCSISLPSRGSFHLSLTVLHSLSVIYCYFILRSGLREFKRIRILLLGELNYFLNYFNLKEQNLTGTLSGINGINILFRLLKFVFFH